MFRVFVNWGMLIGSNRTNLKFNDEPNTINGFMDQVVGLFTYNGPRCLVVPVNISGVIPGNWVATCYSCHVLTTAQSCLGLGFSI
jgi:hypothetical protein